MKVYIDKETCIGCGTCSVVSPDTFKMNDDEAKAYVVAQDIEDDDLVQDAMDSCPVTCIHQGLDPIVDKKCSKCEVALVADTQSSQDALCKHCANELE